MAGNFIKGGFVQVATTDKIVIDNNEVIRIVAGIKKIISDKNNVHIINIHSFEFTLLSFEFFEKWILSENAPLRIKREELFRARELFIDLILKGGTAEDLMQFKKLFSIFKTKNTEQISAKLLQELTKNTGFYTEKGCLGSCFIENCCNYYERSQDNNCGLDVQKLSGEEKKKQLIEHSCIKNALSEVGLL